MVRQQPPEARLPYPIFRSPQELARGIPRLRLSTYVLDYDTPPHPLAAPPPGATTVLSVSGAVPPRRFAALQTLGCLNAARWPVCPPSLCTLSLFLSLDYLRLTPPPQVINVTGVDDPIAQRVVRNVLVDHGRLERALLERSEADVLRRIRDSRFM